MAAKKKGRSPFTKGRVTKSSGGSAFVGIKDGESITFAPLVGLNDLDSANMHEYWEIRPAVFHPCIGADCPGCALGNEPRLKSYMPILRKTEGVGIFPFTISVYNQLEELEDALMEDDPEDSIKGVQIKISRKGAGMSTRYNVIANGKRVKLGEAEVPDFLSQLGPTTVESINELLAKSGLQAGDDEDEESATEDDGDWGE